MEAPGRPKLKEIVSALSVITDPQELGIQLDVPDHELDKFENNYPQNVDRQLIEVIKYWQKNKNDCSWEALANAVERVGKYGNLVKELREKHSKHVQVRNVEDVADKTVREKTATKARTATKLSDRPKPQELKKYVWKHVGEKWEELAILLGLDEDEESEKKLEDIKEKRQNKASMAANDVLMFWQSCDRAEPTWERLIDALETADLNDAVKSIKDYLGDNEATNNQQSPPSVAAGVQQPLKGSQDISQAHNSTQQPKTKGYAVQMKAGEAVRNYQYELAAPGIEGENYIVVAPTNSGKTLVAALIIADHLEKNKQQKRSPRVAVVVKTRPLADQQRERLEEFIPSAVVECRTGNRGDIKERQQQLHIKDALPHSEIVVCTAGKLLDEFKKGMVAMREFSLMIIDECHNTEKSSNYAQIMHMYLEQKLVPGQQLPQVVGLTATPGVGRNPGLNPAKVIENLITLCAHMDATGGIQTVEKYADELNKFVRKPEFFQEVVDQSQQREAFLQRIQEDMTEYESFLMLNLSEKLPRWSQRYEQAIKESKKALEENENPDDRDRISAIRLLECCSQTLTCYMELPCARALDPLEQYEELFESDKNSKHENHLLEKFTKLKSDLASLNVHENPILEKLEGRLSDTFKRNRDSEGIVFVRTREQAEAINDWIGDSKFAQELDIRSSMLLGHKQGDKGPSMSDEEQKVIVDGFHRGDYNLLIATSVAEEGLDIKQCNLVMRLHISSAKSKAQMQGRARAEDSEIITIVSNDPKKLYRDMLNDSLLLLMETLIKRKVLPEHDSLRERIVVIQAIIRDEVKREKAFQEARMRTHEAQNVELRCKKCKITACRGSDIYILDNTGHHVVPGGVLDYELVEHARPGIVDGCGKLMIEKRYKVHCTECNASWGVLGTWPSMEEFPILKCDSFNFFVDERRVSVPKWNKKPFETSPLSEWLAGTKKS